ncbi:LLM class flavin-dependent oxidoreductase [Sphingobium sp. WCS2017Hpa-17]|uniref:LLM class flavin-dependent oxidoreductase n=1 Tax=Sphingobium sp. WCS2017Hpa-17 TaxID=3073638 RepID=UPI002889EA35|nr:LLM class flavin-dependent oxidoreductase [Sphingobium sp. WCS2017Hpa-17]
MKFSLIYEAQIVDISRESEQRCYRDMIEQCLLAEAQGFDTVWAVEHTALTQYAHMSAPETFLSFIAGATTRLHVGHGVVCLPPAMNHPIKVAQRIATLDIMSQGRLHFGIGKGGTQQEAGAYGYDLATLQPQIDEMMYLIPKIMVQDEIEHSGEFVQIPRRPIHPKPYQDPHPPMYMACTSEPTLIRAGERGLGALVLGFSGPEEIARKNAIYRRAFSERDRRDQVGFRPNEHLAALCPVICLEDRDEARRIGLRGQRFFGEAIHHWYGGGPKPSTDDLEADQLEAELHRSEERLVARLGDALIPVTADATDLYNVQNAYGTPDDVIAHLERLFEAGADEILFLPQMGTVPHEAIMETIRLIGEKVIPHFRQRALAA